MPQGKRFFSLLLALVMIISLFPSSALAATLDDATILSSSPVAEESVVEEPAEEPTAEDPVVEEPVEEPAAEEPAAEEPVEEPAAEDPVVEEPVEDPVAEEAVEPVVDDGEDAKVAQVGDTEYATLQAAIDAADSGDTITLIADVTILQDTQVVIPEGKTITLCLNGKTVTGGNYNLPSNAKGYIIANNGTLTINGDENSVMSANGLKSGYGIIVNNGTLTLNGGTYTGSEWNGTSGDYPGYTIRNCGTMTVNEGTKIHGTFGCVSNPGGNLTVNGGTFTNEDLPGATHYLICAWGNGTVTIDGGDLTFYSTDANAMGSPIFGAWDGGSFIINGGTFDANQGAMGYSSAAVTIKGGTFKNAARNVFQNSAGISVLLAEGYAIQSDANGNYVAAELPNAEVKNLGAITVEEYSIYNGSLTEGDEPIHLQIAMQFIAKDSAEEAAKNAFGDYTTDFYITMEGASANTIAMDSDCYLAGNYGTFGWIMIPLEGMEIERGKIYPVITSVGFDFSYEAICSDVKDFKCGIHLSDAVIAANPNMTVKLELGLSENLEAAQAADSFITVDEPYIYDTDDLLGYVAQIDETKYTSLAEAVAAAQSGDTVTLLGDIALTETVKVAGKAITLDLNGKTVSGICNGSEASLIYIENDAALTLKDSVGGGKLTFASGSSNVGYTVDVKGAFTLESGIVELTGSWSIGYAVNVRPNSWGTEYTKPSVFTMNGGSLISSDGAVRLASTSSADHTAVSASFVMNGGSIDAAWDGVFIQQSNAVYDVLSFTMNGGTIESDLNPIRVYGPAPTSNVNGQDCMTIVLNNGTLTYTGTEAREWIIENILRVGGGSSVDTVVGNGGITLSEAFVAQCKLPEGYAALKDLNGNYVVGAKPTATVKNLGPMMIPESDYMVYGGSVDGDMPLSFVMQFLADQDAKDMETSPYADWYADFVLTFTGLENGSFTAAGCYLAGYYGDFGWVKVPVDGMTIEEGARYPVMLGVGMGQKYDYICESVKDFRCALYLTDEILEANPELQVNLELSIVDNSKGEEEALDALADTSLKYVNVVGDTEYTADNFAGYVARIGETRYATLDEAIEAAGDYDTITLLTDISASEIITIDKPITLDGNGKTLTSTAARAINVNCDETVVIKNLTIDASGERAINVIQKAGTLSLYNVTATAANYTVNVATTAGAARVIINKSTLTGACTVNVSAAGASVSIKNSTITCADNNASIGESYAALSLNAEAVGGSIVATGSTVNVTEGSDSYKGRNSAENGTVTINSSTEGVKVMVAVIAYEGSSYYYGFESLADAIEFAKTGNTITLIRDITLSEPITVETDDNITLDLNGKTVSQVKECIANYALITNKGTLVIEDSVGGGKISFTDTGAGDPNYGWGTYTISNSGNLTVNSGTIENLTTIQKHMYDAIDNNSTQGRDAILTINGGTVTCANYFAIRLFVGSTTVKNSVTVNGGTVYGGRETVGAIWLQNAGSGARQADLTVGGSSEVNGVYLSGGDCTNITVSINSANLKGTPNTVLGSVGTGFIIKKSEVGIWGIGADPAYNKAARIGDTYYDTLAEAYAAAQSGETIILLADIESSEIITIDKPITLDGNGKTLTSTAGRAINVSGADGVTIKNLTINCSGERAINVIDGATNVTVDNVTATAANYTLNVAASAANAVVTVKNSDLTGLNVVNVGAVGANITVTDTKITCNDQSEGEEYAALCLNKDATGSSIIANGCTFDIKGDSKNARNSAEDGTITIDGSAEGIDTSVAYINYGNYHAVFSSLADAIEAAKAGNTVVLIRDIEESEIMVIDKAITLDGNGKTLTSTAARAINVSGADGVTIENLTISCSGERAINVIEGSTNVTVDNVTATADNYTLNVAGSAANAVVTVKNSDLTGLNVVNVGAVGANVTVTDTKITCNDQNEGEEYAALCLNKDATGGTITATGCTFDIKGDSKNARNSAEDGTITIDGTSDGIDTSVAYINYGDYHAVFSSLADAIEAAKAGETVVLIRDIEESEIMVIDKAITLDGNGKTLTSTAGRAINVSGADGVTIENLTISCSGERAINVIEGSTNVTVDNVTATAANYTLNVAGSAANAVVTVKNSDLTGLNVVNVGAAGANVTVTDTKITCNDQNEGEEYAALCLNKDATGSSIIVNGCTFDIKGDSTKGRNSAEDGTITIDGSTEGIDTSVAYIAYGNYHAVFSTLAEAISAAQNGETVVLIRDIEESEIVVINKAITLDGNGKTLTSTAGRAINVSGADGVTIENLTISCSGERAINVIDGATNVTVDNVTATAANYTLNVAASAPEAQIAVTNSTLTGACTVNVSGKGADVTIENSTVNCADNNTTIGESYAALSLNAEAIGGSIIATNTTVTVTADSDSYKGRNSAENGTVTINGSSEDVVTMVAVITYEGSDYYYGFESLADAIEFATAGDTVTLLRANAEKDVPVTKAITLELNGKSFTGSLVLADAAAAVTAPEGLTVSSSVAGFTVTYADGSYSLGEIVAAIQSGRETYTFASLAEAIDNAYPGETVKLLADIELSETITMEADDNITLDLNGKVIDGTERVRIAIMSYGNLTLLDSSAEQTGAIKAGIGTGGNAVNICAGSFIMESGRIYSKNNAILIDEEAATVTIKGGTITADTATDNSAVMYVSSTSETVINIEGGEMTGYNGILLWNNTTVNMTGGSIDAQGRLGIQGNGARDNTEINISGSASVSGLEAAIYHPQGGKLNISGDASLTGATGVIVKGGTVNISGGTISGTGTAAEYNPVSSGFSGTGDGLYVEHFDNSPNSENYGTPTVTVTGGTFTSTNGKAVASYANSANGIEALTGFITGGTFNSDVSAYCTEGLFSAWDGSVYVIKEIPELPTATVTAVDNDELTFALNFKADEVTEEQLAYYGDWYADFVLTVNKDVTFNANGGADGHLSGQYDAWSENWVNVPFENVTLKAGEPLKIMEYAAELMGQSGLKLTYNDVYNFVKDFDCGVFFEPAFLANNPDLKVTLELRMYNNEDETESYAIGEMEEFTAPTVAAQIGDAYYITLQDAIDAAEEGAVITLRADGGIAMAGKVVTIETNGHTATVAALSGYTVIETETAYMVQKAGAAAEDAGPLAAYIDLDNSGSPDGSETVTTLQAALNAAGNGQTVRLTGNITGDNALGTVIIPSGVTLDIQAYTLEAEYVIGLNGSFLTGTTVTSDGTGGGKLIVAKENVALSTSAYINAKGQDVLPVWIEGEGYIFSLFDAINASMNPTLTITDSEITAVFRHNASGYTNKQLLMYNGGSPYGISVKITLTWENWQNGEFSAMASQTFSYSDDLIKLIADNAHDYTFKLSNYEGMNLHMESLQVVVTVESDCGAIATGNELNRQ